MIRMTTAELADAEARGEYRRVNRRTDHDVSGIDNYGYDYTSSDGAQSVTIWLTDGSPRLGLRHSGAFVVRMPIQ
jgi:hypothetical protein